jgi:3'-phosphoadenosine 5'-phosphosulfate sulfotransferase (PAPS reductase)/FAD synthetase
MAARPAHLKPIARKQRTRHEDWLDTADHFYRRPDVLTARTLVARAAHRLQSTLDRLGVTSAAYSWSGGKDSMACHLVAKAAGYADRGVVVLTSLEYPAFDHWVQDHAPAGCVTWRRPLDLHWLADHPDWLFPTTSTAAARWFAMVQHRGQREYMRSHTATALLMGRRVADGNHCGDGGVYRDREGFWRVSPIWDWSHEDVLCVLGANRLELAPCYGWPEGFRVATGPWPKRRRHPDGLGATWRLVHQIDPSVVAQAALYSIPGAGECLRTVGR